MHDLCLYNRDGCKATAFSNHRFSVHAESFGTRLKSWSTSVTPKHGSYPRVHSRLLNSASTHSVHSLKQAPRHVALDTHAVRDGPSHGAEISLKVGHAVRVVQPLGKGQRALILFGIPVLRHLGSMPLNLRNLHK